VSERSQKIAEIIEARKPFAVATEKKIEQLRAVDDSVRRCASFVHTALQRQLTDEQRNILQSAQEVLRLSSDVKIPKCRENLGQMCARFSRPTLNIGVVGNARQGKSTLLQALTGLSDDEIPAAETDHCTGAPSVIINDSQTYADVEFYDEQTFFNEVLLPFYEKLELSPRPSSVRDFESSPLPVLQSPRETDKQLYAKLAERHEHYGKYRALLNQRPKRIERNEFLDHIAQQKNGAKIYNWVAVKMVSIHCPFKVEDAGKLSVCDTPGLGDFVCGAEDNLVNNIGNNLDTVVMLKRVPNGGIVKPEDTQLFDLIPKAIPELPPKDWSYYIVNRKDHGENEKELAAFQNNISEKIITRRLITLNARDSQDVLRNFDEILQNVAVNQTVLDKRLYESRLDSVKPLLADIMAMAKKLSQVFPTADNASNREYTTAQTMFSDDVWSRLGYKLHKLVKKYADELEHEQGNSLFLDNLAQIENDLQQDPGLPSKEEFEMRAATSQPQPAYAYYGQAIRRHILRQFERVDVNIKSLFDTLRDEAKQCFTSEDGGKFANVKFDNDFLDNDTQEEPISGRDAWWDSLADEIMLLGDTDRAKKTAQLIANALRQFSSATLTFRGFILPRIIPHFDVLNTSSDAHNPFRPKSFEESAENLISCLDAATKNGVDKAIDQIKSFAKEPSMALFATIEEVRDAVLRTNDEKSSERIWSNFAADHRSEVFPETFKEKEADTKFRKEWNDEVAKLQQSVNEADS